MDCYEVIPSGQPLHGKVLPCVTIMQPFAELLMMGVKQWATIGHQFDHRGPVAIYAHEGDWEMFHIRRPAYLRWLEDVEEYTFGEVIGIADLVTIMTVDQAILEISSRELELDYWTGQPKWAWQFTNVRRIEPTVELPHATGIRPWRVPEESLIVSTNNSCNSAGRITSRK